MFDRVLVPLDRSDLSDSVLLQATDVARAFASPLTLLHVFEETDDGPSVDPLDWYLRRGKAQAHLNRVFQRLCRNQLTVESVLLDGHPAERILAFAQESSSPLILLNGGAGNLGRVAYKIASRARHSLLMARGDEAVNRDRAYRRILVPLDGSRRAECVLPTAAALAAQSDATLVLVHVVECPPVFGDAPDLADTVGRIVARNREESHAYLGQLQSHLDVPCESRLMVARDRIAALRELSRREEADLVLLCAHGYGGRRQQPFGRVAMNFLYEGEASLLLLQDFPPAEIEASPAERAAESSGPELTTRQNTVPTITFH